MLLKKSTIWSGSDESIALPVKPAPDVRQLNKVEL